MGGRTGDTTFAGTGPEAVYGSNGPDTVLAGDGDDALPGDAGPNDVCDGGPGADVTHTFSSSCETKIGIP